VKSLHSDRLWPVLLVTAFLLGCATYVEVAVSPRHVEELVFTIEGSPGDLSDDGDGGAAPEGGTLDDTHLAARVAARRGDLEDGIALFRKVVETHPDEGRLLAELGYWLLADDQDPEALEVLEVAHALAPSDAWVALTLGRARSHADDLQGAEVAYRIALANRPGYGTARVSLGSVLRRQGRVDEAIAVLEAASLTGGNEDRARALAGLGRAQLAAGLREQAIRSFQEAIQRAPASVEVRLAIARAWMGDGDDTDLPTALGVLDETVRLAPDVPTVHSALGRVQERLNDPMGAERSYREALRLDPYYVYPRRRLLRLALEEEDYPLAELQVALLLDQEGDDPENQLLAGLVATRAGDWPDARVHYRHALDLTGGDYPEAWFNLGLLEKRAGNLDAAIAAYEAALEVRPDYQAARNNLAVALEAAGRFEEAEALWRLLVELDPTYTGAWQNLADLLRRQDRHEEAITCYRQVLAAEPENGKAALNLGVTYARAGEYPRAIATYRTLLAREPRNVTAWYDLGLALKAIDDPAAAREALQTAVALDEDHRSAKRSLASLESGEGRLEVATALYEDLLDRDPADTAVRLSFARVLRDRDDRAGCLREARAVLAADPDSKGARRLVRRCAIDKEKTP